MKAALFVIAAILFAVAVTHTAEAKIWAIKTSNPEALAQRQGLKLIGAHDIDGVAIFESSDVERDVESDPSADPDAERAEPQEPKERHTRLSFADPGLARQWHIYNQGGGVDMNLEEAWRDFNAGDGVVVAVIDDGLEIMHPDIRPVYNAAASRDVCDGDANPSPSDGMYHGTSCGGLVAAAANSVCGVGVAYNASLAGVRLLGRGVTDSEEASALINARSIVSIYSCSWGPPDDGQRLEGPHWLAKVALETGTKTGRGGLGAIYVWAAGNGNEHHDNCNYDGYASSRFTIAVAAVDSYGKHTYYSEECAALVVSAPSSSTSDKIYTTDLTGRAGASAGDCNDRFGGTSAACPMVAGVAALMLSERPGLSWRDVQNVLVRSARKTDPTDADWTQNGAGLWVNHKYGFGLVDAYAAVSLASTTALLGVEASVRADSDGSSLDIPDGGSLRVYRTVLDVLTVEHVEVVVNIKHPSRGQLKISLLSPSNTTSVLANKREDTTADYNNWTFTTTRCWGETSRGDWTLVIEDTSKGFYGKLTSWSLVIYGTRP